MKAKGKIAGLFYKRNLKNSKGKGSTTLLFINALQKLVKKTNFFAMSFWGAAAKRLNGRVRRMSLANNRSW